MLSVSQGLQNRLNTPTITGMNVDRILRALNRNKVAYMLIGGVNYLLRHQPVLTYDVDVWIEDTEKNLRHCEEALSQLKAEWGSSDNDWIPVAKRGSGWLKRQTVFCMTSPAGAIDVFRQVKGLNDWRSCFERSVRGKTGGIPFHGLSDKDMLKCQKALNISERKQDRIRTLNRAIRRKQA